MRASYVECVKCRCNPCSFIVSVLKYPIDYELACVAAGQGTRLNHLYCIEGLQRLRRGQTTSKSPIFLMRAHAFRSLYCPWGKKWRLLSLHSLSPLHRETGNSGLKIKWFAPFHLKDVWKIGLSFEAMEFFYCLSSLSSCFLYTL